MTLMMILIKYIKALALYRLYPNINNTHNIAFSHFQQIKKSLIIDRSGDYPSKSKIKIQHMDKNILKISFEQCFSPLNMKLLDFQVKTLNLDY